MKRKTGKYAKKKAAAQKKTVAGKKPVRSKIFIPHSPMAFKENNKAAWTKRPGPVKWSEVQRPSNLLNPSLPPGYRDSVSPPPGRIGTTKPASEAKKKSAEQR